MGELRREVGGIVPGRYYLISCRTRTPHPDPWSQCCSPVNLQIKSFLGEPFGFRAGAGLGTVASQVASIRCWPAQDIRAANPKVYETASLTMVQRHKEAKLELPNSIVFTCILYCFPFLGFFFHSLFLLLPLCESLRVSLSSSKDLWTLCLQSPYPLSVSGLLSPPSACLTEVSWVGSFVSSGYVNPPLLCAPALGPFCTPLSCHH